MARLEGLPVLVLTTVRPGEPGTQSDTISAIARAGRVVQPSALSREATGMLVRATLGLEANGDLCRSCHSATAGNPFLLRCLLDELHHQWDPPEGASMAAVTEVHSEAILRATLARLERLPQVARVLASAVAVFGASCSLGDAAAIAGLEEDQAVAAADALAAQGVILGASHWSSCTRSSAPPSTTRSRVTGESAGTAAPPASWTCRTPTDEIAVHLLPWHPPATRPWSASSARPRPRRWALARRSPRSDPLERWRSHLRHTPRVAILRELGAAEASLDKPAGAEHLQEALRSSLPAKNAPRSLGSSPSRSCTAGNG